MGESVPAEAPRTVEGDVSKFLELWTKTRDADIPGGGMNRKRLMVPKAPVLPHPNTLCLTFCGRWWQHILTGLLHKRGHTLGHKAQTLGGVLKKVLHGRHGTLPRNGWTTNKQSATTKFTCAAPAPCHPHVTALPPLPHVTAPLAVPGASSFSRYPSEMRTVGSLPSPSPLDYPPPGRAS